MVESNKQHLADVCCDAWERLTKLEAIKRRLQIEIAHKSDTVYIDEDQMNMDKHSTGISYQLEPFRTLQKLLLLNYGFSFD